MAQAQSVATIMVAHAVGGALLVRSTLFPLLEEDSLAMAHMDPSVIIATPFPFAMLCRFVGLSLAWNLMVGLAGRMMLMSKLQIGAVATVLMVVFFTATIHFVFVLCGTHPTMSPIHTLLSAFYLAFNVLLPVILISPLNSKQHQHNSHGVKGVLFKLKEVGNYLFGPPVIKEQSKKEHTVHHQQQMDQLIIQQIHQCTLIGIVLGMGSCAILRVLDHGMQIQRYPIPIIVGATFGRCGGVLLGATVAIISPRR